MVQIRLAEIESNVGARGRDFGATLPADRVVLTGLRSGAALPSGIFVSLHSSQAQHDFETRMMRSANVVMHMVLAGRVETWIGGQPVTFERKAEKPVPLYVSALTETAEFRRRVSAGQILRKISIVIPWAWLDAHDLGRADLMQGTTQRNETLIAPHEEIGRAEALLEAYEAGSLSDALLSFRKEALAMSLIRHALESLSAGDTALRPKERENLARMLTYASQPGPVPPLEDIAAMGGMSVSTMRRLFQRAYRRPVLAHVRETRLDKAAAALRSGVTVADAARVAGYETPAAFATAFRQRTGICPSRYRRGG